jgi:hypothetical protein
MGLVKLGTVSLDGAKIKANASKHKALSWQYANKLDAQLQTEVEELMRLAEAADNESLSEGMDIPEELKRREQRLSRIAAAKAEIEAWVQERFEREQAEYEAKLARRARKRKSAPARNPAVARQRRSPMSRTKKTKSA